MSHSCESYSSRHLPQGCYFFFSRQECLIIDSTSWKKPSLETLLSLKLGKLTGQGISSSGRIRKILFLTPGHLIIKENLILLYQVKNNMLPVAYFPVK